MKHNHSQQWTTPRSVQYVGIKMLVRAILGLLVVTLIALPGPAFAVHRSFSPATNWTGHNFQGSRGTFFADVTGDGKADAIAVNDDRIWFRRSNGSSFSLDKPNPNEQLTSSPFYGERGRFFFADVTGDKKADPHRRLQ